MVRDAKLYDALGVAPDASEDEIRRAYKKLVALWHPDKNVGNEDQATAKFKEIQHAHNVISDPEKRRIYDQVGEEGLNEGAPDPSAAGSYGGGFAPAGDGRTFVFTSNGGQNLPPEMMQHLFGAFGSGAAFGGGDGDGAQQTFIFRGSGGDEDSDDAGGMFGGMFGGEPQMPCTTRRSRRGRRRGGRRRGKRAVGPFNAGAQVRAAGLTGATELNGELGTVTGMTDAGRVKVDFGGSAEKALRPANLYSVHAGGWAKGAAVVAEGLSGAAHLNGRQGNVIGHAANGRVEVLFDGDGVKALQPANISPAA
eukprot:TRINITY_DN1661_c0_g1_i4.p1 TRINITY_DN1661_c0_g1~~TRINITY_DN1661_c0_g1_i4.p1  ORF type:complete len:335 (+),score=112.18 TRINITY_DN1661_c0_g1_i4:79-1005(+)